VGHEHTHEGTREHRQGHHHHPEDHAARRHPEFVVLEIGEGLGALVVHTDAAMHGVEIEISHAGRPRDGSHKQVLERGTPERPQFTAVFDALQAGTYSLWTEEGERRSHIEVVDGHVTELDWRAA